MNEYRFSPPPRDDRPVEQQPDFNASAATPSNFDQDGYAKLATAVAQDWATPSERRVGKLPELAAGMPRPLKDAKATNPKDAIGSDKLPLHLVPDSLVAYAALAFLEGALKYGQFNWRAAGVRASIYLSAMERHMRKFKSGEWADEKTGVPHLASIIACCGIILDAKLVDKLNDDRPPAMYAFSGLLDRMSIDVVEMKQLFNGFTPHQYTIADSEACK